MQAAEVNRLRSSGADPLYRRLGTKSRLPAVQRRCRRSTGYRDCGLQQRPRAYRRCRALSLIEGKADDMYSM